MPPAKKSAKKKAAPALVPALTLWSANSRACKTTWSTLRILNQLEETFAEAGTLKMKGLTFWNQSGSADNRESMARTLSIQVDNVFTLIRGARYEDGASKPKAIEGMLAILLDESKTVVDLALAADALYKFWKEDEDDEV